MEPQKKRSQKKTKEKKSSAQTKSKKRTNFLSGMLFLLVGGLMCIFTALLLFDRVFVPSDLEKIIPEKDLIAFVNVERFENFSETQNSSPEWEQALKKIEAFFFDFHPDEIIRWRGKRGGIAVYGSSSNTPSRITFVSIGNKKALSEYLASQKRVEREDFSGHTILTLSSPRAQYCFVLKGYFTCSQEKESIVMLLSAQKEAESSLFLSQDFERTVAELPRNHIMRLFIRSKPFLTSHIQTNEYRTLMPLFQVASEVGMALTENRRNNALESHILLYREEISPEKDLSNEALEFTGGTPSLLSYIPRNAHAFIWGNDFTEDFLQGLTYFDSVDSTFRERFQNILSQKISQFFGEGISWTFDILPLLEGEFVVGSDQKAQEIFVLLRVSDTEFASNKLEKFKVSLEKMSSRFLPRIIENTLEDGSTIREIFPEEVNISVNDTEEDGVRMISFGLRDLENQSTKFVLAQKGKILMFSTFENASENILQKRETPDILQNFPLRFAGSSEEVFVITEDFLSSKFSNLGSLFPPFEKIYGKIVNTPLFFRIHTALQMRKE